MSLTNPNNAVTAQRLSEFYQEILPYLNGPEPNYKVYGIRILRDESVPSAKVEYLEDAIGMTPAHMDYENGIFDYGSWGDAFFMPKPCMLKYDGTVDYYLDPNDYTKKEDGTASDIADASYDGNAMMEWPKIWLKIVPDATKDNKEADIFISNEKVDEYYTDWNYHNSLGESVDHFYTAIYHGSIINEKLRSISGQHAASGYTAQNELNYAQANNPTGSLIWTTEIVSDVDLINILLLLISKTTNSQAAFGIGLSNGGSGDAGSYVTGTQNDKGLFYGTSSGTASVMTNAVKVFGMENWWGLIFRRCLGEINISGSRKRKLTYGTEDGSTVIGYNLTGNGYISCNVPAPSGSNGGFVSEFVFTKEGLFPTVVSGGSSTYYTDGMYFANTSSGTMFVHGGRSGGGDKNGALYYSCDNAASAKSWNIGASLSARPLF